MTDIDPDLMDKELDEEIASEAGYAALVAVITAVEDTSTNIMTYGLKRALQNKEIRSSLRSGIMPYLFAAGFLSFAGREMNKDSITAIAKALGLKPNDAMIEKVLKTGLRSHLIYVYAYYFLVAIGREPSDETISAVVESLGMKTDRTAILETYGFIKALSIRRAGEA
ncbi:MAG TPA: hypothetical protein VND15_03370 [Candidatus Acidoferrales bacterium]|nr:hypothetical protein [Candidatus Acidoferrales bacterium]